MDLPNNENRGSYLIVVGNVVGHGSIQLSESIGNSKKDSRRFENQNNYKRGSNYIVNRSYQKEIPGLDSSLKEPYYNEIASLSGSGRNLDDNRDLTQNIVQIRDQNLQNRRKEHSIILPKTKQSVKGISSTPRLLILLSFIGIVLVGTAAAVIVVVISKNNSNRPTDTIKLQNNSTTLQMSSTSAKSTTTTTTTPTSTRTSITSTLSTIKPTLTTMTLQTDFSCESITAQLFSQSKEIVCTIGISYQFDKIEVTRTSKGSNFLMLLSKDGSVLQESGEDSNINIIYDKVSNFTIRFLNVACYMQGEYNIHLLNGSDTKVASGSGRLSIFDVPGKPILTLNADQVIDLGFYRDDHGHACTANVGLSTNYLIIEIQYSNKTHFQEFPASDFDIINREKTVVGCQHKETIKFGIRFTSDMDGGKVRCRVSGLLDNGTQTVENLALIPRDICACATNAATRGHPTRCDAWIQCIVAYGITYPFGATCVRGPCRDSITGICSDDCSACDEEVPSDFCTTPGPTLTTPAPSVHIYCNDNTTLLNTGPVIIVCFLNMTSFSSINVMHQITAEANSVIIAQIESNTNIKILDSSIKFGLELDNDTINITVHNATCSAQGIYRISVDLGGASAIAHGELKILSKPGKPIMEENHKTYQGRNSMFSCTANVGNDPGTMEFLVRKPSDLDYTIVTTEDSNVEVGDVQPLTMECNNRQTVTYSPLLSSDWNLTSIKCRVKNDETISVYDESLYSSETQTIVLIGETYCFGFDEYKIHPRGCHYYVRCVNTISYSFKCPNSLCFNFNEANPFCDTCEPCIDL